VSNEQKKLHIVMLVDFMATMFGATEEEYEDIRGYMNELFPDCALTFEEEVHVQDLRDRPEGDWDIYVFDWGGLLPGAEDLTRSIYKTLLYLTRSRGSKLFILWSAFTDQYYKEAIEDEFPEFIAPNVVCRQDERYEKRCRLFLDLSEKPQTEKPYYKYGEPTRLITPSPEDPK
jgi:hypothetical protein